MQKITPEDGQSANIIEENIGQLKALFPDAFTDDGVNFDVLRQLLGDAKVLDEGEEKYGLNWHGKKQARQIALTPSTGTLIPCPDNSLDWENSKNIFIEGDNLESLKLLRKSYAGQVKLVYIDPPYNTGNEFIYPDKYDDNLQTYLMYTGQVSESGETYTSNKEYSGRRHTNWLNMMYPRLKLAKDLMHSEGVIFISIDENEVHNLREICDEIFGQECFLGAVSRATGTPTGGGNSALVGEIDYLLVYARRPQRPIYGVNFSDDDAKIYDRQDERGRYLIRTLRRTGGEDRREDRPSMYYAVTAPDGTEVFPIAPSGYESRWICGKDKFAQMEKDGLIEWGKSEQNGKVSWSVYQKFYLEGRTKQPSNFWTKLEGNKKASRDLKGLFDGEKVFTFPKPLGLLQHIIEISGLAPEDIVLDFFAGSGTTGHAVWKYNAEHGTNLRFILIQLPEPLLEDESELGVAALFCKKMGIEPRISALTIERLRRSALEVSKSGAAKLDLGFKTFQLSESNIRIWNPDRADLEQTLLSHQDHLIEGRTEMDVLYELLLKRGVELTAPVDTKTVAGKAVYCIGFGVLFACLSTSINASEVDEVAQGILAWHKELQPETDSHVFFRDSAFADDIAKTNMAAILEQNGISHVRSL